MFENKLQIDLEKYGTLTTIYNTGMVNLTELAHRANVIRVQKKLPKRRLHNILKGKDFQEFISELIIDKQKDKIKGISNSVSDEGGISNLGSLEVSKEDFLYKDGRTKHMMGSVLVALKIAMYLDKELEVVLLKRLITESIIDARQESVKVYNEFREELYEIEDYDYYLVSGMLKKFNWAWKESIGLTDLGASLEDPRLTIDMIRQRTNMLTFLTMSIQNGTQIAYIDMNKVVIGNKVAKKIKQRIKQKKDLSSRLD